MDFRLAFLLIVGGAIPLLCIVSSVDGKDEYGTNGDDEQRLGEQVGQVESLATEGEKQQLDNEVTNVASTATEGEKQQLDNEVNNVASTATEGEQQLLNNGGTLVESSTEVKQKTVEDLQGNTTDLQKSIPQRFWHATGGNMYQAQMRWNVCKRWREKENIDSIIDEPQWYFEDVQRDLAIYLHNFDKEGHPIVIQYLGRIDLQRLSSMPFRKLTRHLAFWQEYVTSRLSNNKFVPAVLILDFKDASMLELFSYTNSLLKNLSDFADKYYPESFHKVFIVNAGGLFRTLWNGVVSSFRPSTKQKITVVGERRAELFRYIARDALPMAYGGTSRTAVGNSEEEKELLSHVMRIRAKNAADQPMKINRIRRKSY